MGKYLNHTSANGWPVLTSHRTGSFPRLRDLRIPGTDTKLTLRDGSAGFLIAHFALWFSEVIEPLDGSIMDDWGYAVRPERGKTDGYSNHASGTAGDLNATQHPMGVATLRTFTVRERARILARLLFYGGCIAWGGTWRRPDAMHFEIAKNLSKCEKVARRLMKTKRGKRVLDMNPGLRKVILS